MSKTLVVFGATGTQGGSVINAILQHPKLGREFEIRAVTRDPSKPEAKALQDKGVSVIKADMLDKDTLRKALAGAHSVFAMTNFWETASKETEVTQGKNMADIAKEVGVKHFIWSSLPNVTKITHGRLSNIPHFDAKAEVEEYIRDLGIPATFFMAGAYMNFTKQSLQKGEDGTYTLSWPLLPTTSIPLFHATTDTGKFVAGILSKGSEVFGKRILGASGWWTLEEICKTVFEVTGVETRYQQVSEEVFKSFLPPFMAEELLETTLFMRDYNYFGPNAREELEESFKVLDQSLTTFREFVQETQ